MNVATQLRQWFIDLFTFKTLSPQEVTDDPLALRTDWEPLSRLSTTYNICRLVQPLPYRCEFRATVGATIFSMIFICIGIGIAVPLGIVGVSREVITWEPFLFGGILGGAFFSIGLFFLLHHTQPIVFDLQTRLFWKGRTFRQLLLSADKSTASGFAEHIVPLDAIYALQLLHKKDSEMGNNYELNLVLQDATRIHVVIYANRRKFYQDVETLATFLRVPVWDAIA